VEKVGPPLSSQIIDYKVDTGYYRFFSHKTQTSPLTTHTHEETHGHSKFNHEARLIEKSSKNKNFFLLCLMG